MQDKEERPNGHGKLVLLMQALNYTSDEQGVCNGYAYMGMQAAFAKELDVFNQRVERLLDIPLDELDRAAEIQAANESGRRKKTKEAFLKENLENYLRDHHFLIDTLAFFDGIELHHQRDQYPELFDGTESLSQNSFVEMITPEKIKNKNKIISLPQELSGVYKQDGLAVDYFGLLREKIKAMNPKPTESICFSIGGMGLKHAVAASYDPQTDKWTLIDANKPPSQEYSDDVAIAQALIAALSENEIVAIKTKVYTLSGNEQLEQTLAGWGQEALDRAQKDITDKVQWVDSREGNWLFTAIAANNAEIIPLVVNEGNVNKPKADNITPLIYAVGWGNKEAIEALINCGADVDLSTNDSNEISPLSLALSKGNMDIIKMLLEKDADPNIISSRSNLSHFEKAILTNDYDLIKLMLDHGAKLFRNSVSGINLHVDLAIQQGYLESLKAILDHGFDPNKIDYQDHNPLLWAVQNKQLEVARLLLEYGADPDQQGELEGKSAREYAQGQKLNEFLDLFDNPPAKKENIQKKANFYYVPKEKYLSKRDYQAFIADLKKYCETRRAEWDLIPKWLHINKKDVESARFKTKMNVLKFGFSVEDKIKATEKLIDALENKAAREPLSDFDIAALLSSRLYSTVVAKHESIFNALEEVIDYKNRSQENKKFSNRAA